jgi:hypothetical protein
VATTRCAKNLWSSPNACCVFGNKDHPQQGKPLEKVRLKVARIYT